MFPKVNQMLFFQISSPNSDEEDVQYKARIADENENALYIEYPLNEQTGRLKRLYLGDELSMFFLNNEGVKHYFDSYVSGFAEDGLKLVKIVKPDPKQITKVQRRNFLRVPAELELAIKSPEQIRNVCSTYDIGGGGVSFFCDKHISISMQDKLECWLLVHYKNGTIEHVPFTAEVVRVHEMESGRKQVMSRFSIINDSDRQKIIRFCFERQLEFRNR